MSRYIDADKLALIIIEHLPRSAPQDTYDAYFDVIRMLKDEKAAPTADVEEVRHGRWKEWNYPGEEYVECTACFTRYYQDDLLMGNEDYPTYCPGCGAKMDGGAK